LLFAHSHIKEHYPRQRLVVMQVLSPTIQSKNNAKKHEYINNLAFFGRKADKSNQIQTKSITFASVLVERLRTMGFGKMPLPTSKKQKS